VVLGLSSPEPDRGRARERIPEPLRRAPHSLGALVWQRRCGLRVREVGGWPRRLDREVERRASRSLLVVSFVIVGCRSW